MRARDRRRHGLISHRARALVAAAAAGLIGATGCYRVPPGKSAVSDITVRGLSGVDEEQLEERLATQKSPKFLAVFPGVVYEYETFDRHALARDLARIERWLRARGYYDAHVQAARVLAVGDKVYVTIEVDQGPPTVVDSLTVAGDETVADDVRRAVRRDIKRALPLGAPLDEDKLADAEKAALTALTSRGHAGATVSRRAEVDVATHRARMYFDIHPGRLAKFGKIRFEGLGELPEDAIRRVFGIEEGDTYSSEELDDSRQALLDLGLFANVETRVDVEEADRSGVAPVTVHCEVSKIRAITLGVGAEFDALKTDGHLITGWQNGNLFGGLRKFDIQARPGFILYPTRLSSQIPAPTDLLYEHRLTAKLRQPALFEKRLTGTASAEYSVYPVILPNVTANVLGYHELRGTVGVERPFGRLFVAPQYGYQANFPFDYLGSTPGVQRLQISYVDLFTYLDFRDNPIKPRRGFFIGDELQRAGSVLQGDANDLKIQPEVRGFIPLPKKIVLALRGSLGFLFPFNYSQFSQINFRNPGPSRIEDASRDYQILYFRGFFAGGPTSNRGYPLRAIGPHDLIPYLSPAGQSTAAGGCDPTNPACLLPTGGLTLWEANAELRFTIAEHVGLATFCDTADVSPFRVDIRLNRPHLSCGAGGRYDTPVGPIRLDIGYRIPGAQYPASATDEVPPPTFLGLPIAVALGIGEAF